MDTRRRWSSWHCSVSCILELVGTNISEYDRLFRRVMVEYWLVMRYITSTCIRDSLAYISETWSMGTTVVKTT
jgi:hypothetical protein